MKITLPNGTVLEMQDAPAPSPEAKDAPTPSITNAPAKAKQADAVTPKPPAVTPQPRPAQPTVEKRDAVPLKSRPENQAKASEEEPSQPAASYSSGNFAHQGGIMDVADPDKGNPSVFQFIQPKGEA
jgi:hypothetical protein